MSYSSVCFAKIKGIIPVKQLIMNIWFHFQETELIWAQSHSGEHVTGETWNGQMLIQGSLSSFLVISQILIEAIMF